MTSNIPKSTARRWQTTGSDLEMGIDSLEALRVPVTISVALPEISGCAGA
jgi:hypothetical protein